MVEFRKSKRKQALHEQVATKKAFVDQDSSAKAAKARAEPGVLSGQVRSEILEELLMQISGMGGEDSPGRNLSEAGGRVVSSRSTVPSGVVAVGQSCATGQPSGARAGLMLPRGADAARLIPT